MVIPYLAAYPIANYTEKYMEIGGLWPQTLESSSGVGYIIIIFKFTLPNY